MTDWRDIKEFVWMGSCCRVWTDGKIERYDGPKLGWNLTGSSTVRQQARQLGLIED